MEMASFTKDAVSELRGLLLENRQSIKAIARLLDIDCDVLFSIVMQEHVPSLSLLKKWASIYGMEITVTLKHKTEW